MYAGKRKVLWLGHVQLVLESLVTAVGKNLARCCMGLSHSRGATALPMRAREVVPTVLTLGW
jgi:hypothetical protein